MNGWVLIAVVMWFVLIIGLLAARIMQLGAELEATPPIHLVRLPNGQWVAQVHDDEIPVEMLEALMDAIDRKDPA